MKVGILTISDRSFNHIRPDEGGPALASIIHEKKWVIIAQEIIPDEQSEIKKCLIHWADQKHIDLILTTGGTGLGPRDVTPEATIEVLEKQLPGLVELMRREGLKETPFSVLSRALAGIRGESIIINFPGNPEGAKKSLRLILPLLEHAHQMILGHDHTK
ncbi:MAG: molybdenum cofactor biosynthesis protein B [Elusimicrobiota bacterium]